MNLILLEPNEIDDACTVRLTDRRAAHIRQVLGATSGTTLGAGVVDGPLGKATVVHISDRAVHLSLSLDRPPPTPSLVQLVIALPRPKVFRRVLQGITAMGVKRVFLLHSWRVEKSYWRSPLIADAALREAMLLGLEQARDTSLPKVTKHELFRPFVEDELAQVVTDTQCLVGDVGAQRACPHSVDRPTTLAIGPEGGFNTFELDLLRRCGFEAVSLGPRALRVEHAVPAMLGRLTSIDICATEGQ